MSSNDLDDSMSSSTIRILTGAAESADCPPSFSQVSSCCASFTCTASAGASRGLRESTCSCAWSERRLQLVAAVSCISPSCCKGILYTLKLPVGTLGHRPHPFRAHCRFPASHDKMDTQRQDQHERDERDEHDEDSLDECPRARCRNRTCFHCSHW